MKKIFLPLLGIAFAFAFTGKKDLPPNIAATLTARYPNAKIKSWELTNDSYKVKFRTGRNKEVSYFSTNGQWLRTEKHIGLTRDLPAAVRHGFTNSAYAAWKVEEIREVSAPEGPIRYVLDIDNGNELDSWHYDAFKKELLLTFDRDGSLLERSKPQ